MIQLSREEALVVYRLLESEAYEYGLVPLEKELRAKLEMFLSLEQTPQLTELTSENENEATTDV